MPSSSRRIALLTPMATITAHVPPASWRTARLMGGDAVEPDLLRPAKVASLPQLRSRNWRTIVRNLQDRIHHLVVMLRHNEPLGFPISSSVHSCRSAPSTATTSNSMKCCMLLRASSEISFPAVLPSVARPCRGAARWDSSMVDLLEVVLEPRNEPAEHFSEARRIM